MNGKFNINNDDTFKINMIEIRKFLLFNTKIFALNKTTALLQDVWSAYS